jgi:hypothetical protein
MRIAIYLSDEEIKSLCSAVDQAAMMATAKGGNASDYFKEYIGANKGDNCDCVIRFTSLEA